MKFRRAVISDLTQLHDMEMSIFPSDQLSRRAFRYHINNPRASICIFETKDQANNIPIICAYYLLLYRQKSARLYSLAVNPAYQGQGLGRKLLLSVIKESRQKNIQTLKLEVRRRDHRTINLYKSVGFTETEILKNYYEDGADGIKMTYQLAKA
jgi:ribosomal-protein-alanine N-acetyltransferase